MALIDKSLGNIFDSIPDASDEEVVDLIAQNENTTIERIISRGQTSPATGWYDQQKDEWVLVLTGKAIISFENGMEVNLKAGDHLNISAHTKHKVKWTDPCVETVWLAVHY
jgi:cupin 2 domain-containing protein